MVAEGRRGKDDRKQNTLALLAYKLVTNGVTVLLGSRVPFFTRENRGGSKYVYKGC